MLKNPQLKEDLILLLQSKRWDMVRAFFRYWETEDEMVDKVILFGHFFMPHYFRDATPEFHREVILMLMNLKNEYFACPRGFSKTTLIQLVCIFRIVNGMEKFIVIIEKTFTEASEVIKGIRDEFEDNDKIKLIYGNLIDKKFEYSVKSVDAKGDVMINKIRLRGKGFNTTIRGLKTRAYRPTLIICDDIEEDEHIDNPDQRKKYENNFNKGILPALDIYGSLKVSGTILHIDSLLSNLIKSHNGKIYRAYDPMDPKNTLLWKERWSYERLEEKKRDMQLRGKSTSAFAQEYLNDPISNEDRIFKAEYLYEETPEGRMPKNRITKKEFEILRRTQFFNVYANIDVGDTIKNDSDWTGVVVYAVSKSGHKYILDARREKRDSAGLIDLIFEIWTTWRNYGLIKIGIEKKGFEDQIKPFIDIKSAQTNIYPYVEELKPMGRNKESRIRGSLEGFFQQDMIIFVVDEIEGKIVPRHNTMDLLEELYNFPSAEHDDLSDALAYSSDISVIPDESEEAIEIDPDIDTYNDDVIYADKSILN